MGPLLRVLFGNQVLEFHQVSTEMQKKKKKKKRGRRPSGQFIVFKRLETRVKPEGPEGPEARVFEITSPTNKIS